ncbi:hypothetical protein C8R47DRAFT_1225882 [Mycena vitilis]|nr:hypothetical protein C8R47DRAFT_1225882 [Mycena vitilis]
MANKGLTTMPGATLVEDLWFKPDSARSTVSYDMVAFPQPADGETELVDGSPVVRLYDPDPDVEVFWRAIFDSSLSYFMPSPEPVELSVVLGIFRLSHRYDVQYLFRRALHHLGEGEWYASTFDEPGLEHMDDDSHVHSLSVALAAIEVPLLRATTGVNEFLTGKSESTSCSHPSPCDAARLKLLRQHFDLVKNDARLDPAGKAWDGSGMCTACTAFSKPQFKTAANDLWLQIPGIFDLPPWVALDEMKKAVMGKKGNRIRMGFELSKCFQSFGF